MAQAAARQAISASVDGLAVYSVDGGRRMTPRKISWRILRDKKGEPSVWILRIKHWTRGVIVKDGSSYSCFVDSYGTEGPATKSMAFMTFARARAWVNQESSAVFTEE